MGSSTREGATSWLLAWLLISLEKWRWGLTMASSLMGLEKRVSSRFITRNLLKLTLQSSRETGHCILVSLSWSMLSWFLLQLSCFVFNSFGSFFPQCCLRKGIDCFMCISWVRFLRLNIKLRRKTWKMMFIILDSFFFFFAFWIKGLIVNDDSSICFLCWM